MSAGLLRGALPLALGALGAASGDLGAALVRMALSLLLVCALAWLLLRFGLPRLLGSRGLAGGSGGALRVVERQALSASKTLWVVELGTRRWLLGGSEAGLALLAELEPERQPPGETGAKGIDPGEGRR